MIKLINIGKKYGDQLIFNDVQLTAQPGDFIGIIGKTGCGKSTLLNIISGYENYDLGRNEVYGKDLMSYTSKEVNHFRNKRIAFLFQSFNLIEELSVYENLKMSVNLSPFKSEQINEYLIKLGMLEYKHKKIKNLSGGQKQRIALLRAIIKDFDILICDEPTGNLDDTNSELILNLIQELCKDKVVIMVTHKKSIANLYFNKIYQYDYNKSTFELIKDHPNNNKLKFSKPKIVKLSKIGSLIHSLKRILMLKTFNIALVIFMSLFMVSYANSMVLTQSKYEDLILENELKFNALGELKGYAEFPYNKEELESDENIDFVATIVEFQGPIKLYETDYKYRTTPAFSYLVVKNVDNGEESTRVLPADGPFAPGKYIVPNEDKITLTTFDLETFPHKDMIVGRMPENEYEAIIDVETLIKLLVDYDFTYSEYLSGNDSLEDIQRIMETKHIQFYQVKPHYENEETKEYEQEIVSIKLELVGFLDSRHLSSEISGIYVNEKCLNNVSEFFYYPEATDVIIYKKDPTEITHDKVMDKVKDLFVLDRKRIDNIDSSYINVRTMVSFNYFLAILSLVFFFVGYVTLIVYTFSHYKRDIALYRSLGYSNLSIMFLLSFNNILLALISFVGSIYINKYFIATLLDYNKELVDMSSSFLQSSLLIPICVIISINILYVVRYSKKSVNSII